MTKRLLLLVAVSLGLATPVAATTYYFTGVTVVSIITQSISGATNVATTSGATITYDTITMAASATLTIQQAAAGQTLNLKICQNGTGGWTPTMAAVGGLTIDGIWPTFTTSISKCGVASLFYDSATTATITGGANQID